MTPTRSFDSKGLPCLSRCRGCGTASFPVKRFCPECGGRDLVSEELPETGDVFSYTHIAERGEERSVVLLTVGPIRVLAALTSGDTPVSIGDRMRLRVGPDSSGLQAEPSP